ncbi:Polyphosphate glucokinase [Synechococcus sp. MIT S9509]|uniref:ROK family protein n=1 Tax=Synechococcus sp. MIT S9509 TaxID=1801630 RepID=UPI0007BB5CC7|nr:ROK family protein [Synechococcus sp. MIT S9509]KZR92593.1 Polyphosphate glucokinase [Synechococcus sp. MIT S9509]
MKESTDTLCIDIGGTGVKLIVVDSKGSQLCDRQRRETPHPGTPEAIIEVIEGLTTQVPGFDRIAVGFPGVVRNGIIETAANLDINWPGTNLATLLQERLHKPTRVANDADVQGYGCVSGEGVEMVLTLGTGMGSALFVDGSLVPNLELAHHLFKKSKTYEDYVGRAALEVIGKDKWIKRVERVISTTKHIWNWDLLHLGGGNSKLLKGFEFSNEVILHSNKAGVLGGYFLWESH